MPVVYIDDRKIEAVKYQDGSVLVLEDSDEYLQGEKFTCAREFYMCVDQDKEADREFRMMK